MTVKKLFAKKGNIGSTAKIVSQGFWAAINQQIINPENCHSRKGLSEEILKVVNYILDVRFAYEPNHKDKKNILNYSIV